MPLPHATATTRHGKFTQAQAYCSAREQLATDFARWCGGVPRGVSEEHPSWGVLNSESPYDAPPCDVRPEVALTSPDVSLGARCVRTDGRVEVCANTVPTVAEPRTFVKWVLKEQHHSHQTSASGADNNRMANLPGLPSTALDHLSATETESSPMLPPRPWVSVDTAHGQNASG